MSQYTDEVSALLGLGLTDAQFAAAVAKLSAPAAAPAPPKVNPWAPEIDPVVPSGTPGTITMPQPGPNGSAGTGHVLSLPLGQQPHMESIGGYYLRTSLQTGGNPDAEATFMILGANPTAQKFGLNVGNTDDWPLIVDAYSNPIAYMSPAEIALEKAKQLEWAKWTATMQSAGHGDAADAQKAVIQANKVSQAAIVQQPAAITQG